jgi:hypothetical protein
MKALRERSPVLMLASLNLLKTVEAIFHSFLPKVVSIRSNWTLAAEVDRTNAIISRQGSRTRSSPLMKATTIAISVLPLSYDPAGKEQNKDSHRL